eukprot:TRINITY_DN1370_c0_g1_i4.p1 TRINITY_DN1370_c0_g1~~TRINITY_DN1370_c0_g1_i4.p1  ORF type:complete len:1101 (+),score=321.45 TRINITY_DN1370_c0_g1_i4:133-3435(+)
MPRARGVMKRRRGSEEIPSSDEDEVERSGSPKRRCISPEQGALSSHVRHSAALARDSDGGSDVEDIAQSCEVATSGASAHAAEAMMSQSQSQAMSMGAHEMFTQDEEESKDPSLIAGTIKSVRLVNFLNHEHFQVDLIRDMNFFTGQNGSGKSAVLTGIIVALGTNSRFASRGARLVDFICKYNGANFCKVAVTLANIGADAYKPQEYGRAVTVERTISRNPAGGATSSFTLKNIKGTTISKRKGDVDDMLECFSWRINNPCTILMQETAKEFLQNSTPSSKYKFFLTGTGLGNLRENLLRVRGLLDELRAVLATKTEALEGLKDELRGLHEERKAHAELESRRQRLEELRRELLWRYVHEKQAEVETLDQNVEKLDQTIANIEDKIAAKDKQRLEVSAKLSEAQVVMERAGAQTDRLNDEKAAAENSLRNIERSKAGIANQLKKERQALKTRKDRKQLLQNHIRDARMEMQADCSAEQRQLEENIERVEAELQETGSRIQQLEQQKRNDDQGELRNRIQHAKQDMEQHAEKKRMLERDLRGLSSSSDRVAIFGHQISKFVEAVKRDRTLRARPPLGPLGAHLNVTDPRWLIAVEGCIKNELEMFVVPESQDAERLTGIGRQMDYRVSVLTSRVDSQLYHIPEDQMPDGRFQPMLSVLASEDARVLNVLIDRANVEKMVLVENNDMGVQAIRSDRRIKKAYEPDGAQHVIKGASGSVARWKPAHIKRRLVADTEQHRRNLMQQVEEVGAQWQMAQESVRELQQLFDRQRNEASQINREIRSLSAKYSAQERELHRLQDSRVEVEPPDIAEMENNLEEVEREIAQTEEKIRCYEADLEVAAAEVDRAKAVVAEKAEELDAHVEEAEHVHVQASEFDNMLQRLRTYVAVYQKKVEEYRAQIDETRTACEHAKRELEELRQHALEMCPEELNPRSNSEKINQLIRVGERELEQSESMNRDLNEVEADFYATSKHFKMSRRELAFAEEVLELSTDMISKRELLFVRILACDIQRIQSLFSRGMRHRGHSGALEFDTEAEELHINVDLQSGMEGERTRSTSHLATLSGGEKSYTTVALLVALWDVINAPVVAVDEFDVFMVRAHF